MFSRTQQVTNIQKKRLLEMRSQNALYDNAIYMLLLFFKYALHAEPQNLTFQFRIIVCMR